VSSTASTAAAPVSSAVTAPASKSAFSSPVSASEEEPSPLTVGKSAAVVGRGVNGRAAAKTFSPGDVQWRSWDIDTARARAAADELGAHVASSLDEALAADLLVTVSPVTSAGCETGSLSAGSTSV